MRNFLQGQGRRRFQPQEYIEYFEDQNLSLTQRLRKIAIPGQPPIQPSAIPL